MLCAAVFLLATVYPGLAPQADAATRSGSSSALRPVIRFLNQDKKETKQFWTKRRMRSAAPIEELLGESEPATWGSEVEGDQGAPRSVPGSGPSVPSSRAHRRSMSLVAEGKQQENSGESVPPGEPIPYTSGVITDNAVFPNITHGKLFFSVPGGSAVCSGTVVTSGTQNVVWTAGHCVAEGDGSGFFGNFLFVPGYKNGVAPQGEWVAEHATTSSQWKNQADFRYDVAALTMAPNAGQEIEEVVGARGIAFNQDPDQAYRSFGHPAAPPFDGQQMRFCDSEFGYFDPWASEPAPMAIGCDMTGGSSGGGWIVEDVTSGEGFVHSVNSYGYDTETGEFADTMFGPQMGDTAMNVYTAAGGEGPLMDTTPPKLTKVVDGPDPFTPLGKRKRATKIRFTLNETAHVTFVIKNRKGAKVFRVPTAKLSPQRYYVKWNGRHFRTNKVVKAGRYTYKITANDMAGNSARKTGKTTVRR